MGTLIGLLHDRSLEYGDGVGYSFLEEDGSPERFLGFQALERRSASVAAGISRFAGQGDRVLLMFPAGIDFIVALFACFAARATAVPTFTPRRSASNRRSEWLLKDCRPSLVLTTRSILDGIRARELREGPFRDIPWAAIEDLASGIAGERRISDPGPDSAAMIQYTSGSTGNPRGVVLTHANILANLEAIRSVFGWTPKDSGCCWLPHYHDMGLFGGILEPLYAGFPMYLMSPASFVMSPVRWLETISKRRCTVSAGPNFAYDLCCQRIPAEKRRGIDLSSWKFALNGAEPIHAETLVRFQSEFGPYGFGAGTFRPCYGLAESTLLVTGETEDSGYHSLAVDPQALMGNRLVEVPRDASHARVLVSSGPPANGQEIAIVDPATGKECAAGEIGELWTRGPSTSAGYWEKPESNEKTFRAVLEGHGTTPFLRTGDLGILHRGRLYVTGRLKDMLIFHGQNHYPQDIELTVSECHPRLRKGFGAAFSVASTNGESLVIVQEIERGRQPIDTEAIGRAIKAAVSEEHGLEVAHLLLLKSDSVPKTSSGKIERRACMQRFLAGAFDALRYGGVEAGAASKSGSADAKLPGGPAIPAKDRDEESIRAWIRERIARRVGRDPAGIDGDSHFGSFGLASLDVVGIAGDLQDWLGRALPATLLFDYPTLNALSAHLSGHLSGRSGPQASANGPGAIGEKERIAIIGLGCRFPGGAIDADSFWDLLIGSRDAITQVPADRWELDDYFQEGESAPGKAYTRWGGFLEDIRGFDAEFFGISKSEAERMDPQQRMLLELSWEALENANILPHRLADTPTGVFLGLSSADFLFLQGRKLPAASINAFSGTGGALSVAAGRISFLLGLTGPSLVVDTACSSSLASVHLAVRSLLDGESDLALAGGANAMLAPDATIGFCAARMMSKDGRCKSFDRDADGYVRGEGGGMVVLKRLRDAIRDGDRVLGTILGSAMNQDGRSLGLTAPNGQAQKKVILEALRKSNLPPGRVSYVEAHGTGTPLGDPIEAWALHSVFGEGRDASNPLRVGTVKSDIGHLEAGAGIAGLIKTVLSLQHRKIPGNRNLRVRNPKLPESPALEFPGKLTDWPEQESPRVAGVSSFGFSGTNVHVIVEEAPRLQPDPPPVELPRHLFVLSARSEDGLKASAARMRSRLASAHPPALADICCTVNSRRSHWPFRIGLIPSSRDELIAGLSAFIEKPGAGAQGLRDPATPEGGPRIAFLFTGQGSQYASMGMGLYAVSRVYRDVLDRCHTLLKDRAGVDLRAALSGKDDEDPMLARPEVAQPALFALQAALNSMWRAWGIVPSAVLGHSLGEYAAAYAAGVLSLEDGLMLTASRGRLMADRMEAGAMAAVFAPEDVVAEVLAPFTRKVGIAAVNGPRHTVVSGSKPEMAGVLERLSAKGYESRALEVSRAFHSPAVEPMLEGFAEAAGRFTYGSPRIPFISNCSGEQMADGTVPDAQYWARHCRAPVLFHKGMQSLWKDGYRHFLEIGPHPVLTGMGRSCIPGAQPAAWLPSLARGREDWATVLDSLSRIYVGGGEIDWDAFQDALPGKPASLPGYPFQHKRHWPAELESSPPVGNRAIRNYGIEWIPREDARRKAAAHPSRPVAAAKGRLLVFLDERDAGMWPAALEALGHEVVTVSPGEGFRKLDARRYQSDPGDARGYARLLSEISRSGSPLAGILMLWPLDAGGMEGGGWCGGDPGHLFQSMTACIQAALASAASAKIWFLTRGSQAAGSRPRVDSPLQGALWGLARTLSLERPDVFGGIVDLDPDGPDPGTAELAREILGMDGDRLIAWRQSKMWVPRLRPRDGKPAEASLHRLDPAAGYLITGGLGGLGLQVAGWLAGKGARNLILVSRSPLPAPDERAALPAGCPEGRRWEAVEAMRRLGVQVECIQADVAEPGRMARILKERMRHGSPAVKGVIHAAGQMVTGSLESLAGESALPAFRSKAQGAWQLHQACEGLDMDFFILFSSVASVWGAGQMGAYAAANAVLDSLAHFRKASGLPATCVNWGPWDGAGMVERHSLGDASQRLGLIPMVPRGALDTLEFALASGTTQAVVAAVDWERFKPLIEIHGPWPFLEGITAEAAGPGPRKPAGAPSMLRGELDRASADQRVALMASALVREACSLLGIEDPSKVSPSRAFRDMGFDSLLAVELKSRVEIAIGTALDISILFNHPTIESLSVFLVEKLYGKPGKPAAIESMSETADPGLGPDLAASLEQGAIADFIEKEVEGYL